MITAAIWIYGVLTTLVMAAFAFTDRQGAGEAAGPIAAGLVLLAIFMEVRRVRRR